MPIYDITTNNVFSEIAKVYDFTNALVFSPIKEAYDVTNDLVYSLVYKNAADPFTFLDYSSKMLDTNYTVMPSSYNVKIEDGSMSPSYGYAFVHYALNGISSICWNTPRDLTGLTTITVEVGYLSAQSVNCYFGISKDTTLAYTGDVPGTIFSKKVHLSKADATHQTYTLDISDADGEYYLKFTIQSASGHTTPQCYIKSITVT